VLPGKGVFSGLIEAGERGRRSKIVNRSGETTHVKTTDEADMPPFYYRIHIPNRDTCGIVVLQRTGVAGIKAPFEQDLARHVGSKGYTLKLGVLTDPELLKAYLEGGDLREVRAVYHVGASDGREFLKHSTIAGEVPQKGAEVEVIFKLKKGLSDKIGTAARVLTGQARMSELVEVYGLDDPKDVVLKIDMGKGAKSFRVSKPQDAGIIRDVTDEVEYDHGQPTFESMDRLAAQWCAGLTTAMAKRVTSS
jgi:hypothetical protein